MIGVGQYPSCHPLGSLPRFIFTTFNDFLWFTMLFWKCLGDLKFTLLPYQPSLLCFHPQNHCSGSFPVALLLTTLTTLLLSSLVIQLPNVAYFFGIRPPSKDSSTLPGQRLRGMATGWHKWFIICCFLLFVFLNRISRKGSPKDFNINHKVAL